MTRPCDSGVAPRSTPPVGQHPATADAWAWLAENRDEIEPERADRIESALREISTSFWEWDREAGRRV